jgi:hypothetical protein
VFLLFFTSIVAPCPSIPACYHTSPCCAEPASIPNPPPLFTRRIEHQLFHFFRDIFSSTYFVWRCGRPHLFKLANSWFITQHQPLPVFSSTNATIQPSSGATTRRLLPVPRCLRTGLEAC